MTHGRACVAALLSGFAIVAASVTSAHAATEARDGDSYGPVMPKSVLDSATASRIKARCEDDAVDGSVPVSISFQRGGEVSRWTARGAEGDLVAQGPGSVAVFGVPVDCQHPKRVAGRVYFDVHRTTGSPGTAATELETETVQYYVEVVPAAAGADSADLSAPLLTGSAAVLLAGVGVVGALRRVRSMTRSRSRVRLG